MLFKKLKLKQIKGKYSNISCNVLPYDHQGARQYQAAKTIPYSSFKLKREKLAYLRFGAE
jgi:hypothetical protein